MNTRLTQLSGRGHMRQLKTCMLHPLSLLSPSICGPCTKSRSAIWLTCTVCIQALMHLLYLMHNVIANSGYLSILTAIFQVGLPAWISRYQNVSILDFTGAKDDGGGDDNWSYSTCKAPVKSSPTTNQHPVFYRPDALPVAQPTVSEH